jgi:2-polyprenyl-3-methyl-5-hydroxy-6-metoxy-1,4-benzoquinol methylase
MITRWSSGTPDDNMAEELLTELRAVVLAHPWWQARARLAIRLLRAWKVAPGAAVLDAGCGWGSTLVPLLDAGYRVTGLDVSRRALQLLDGPGRTLVEADLTCPPPASAHGAFDAALALDVIEHVDDDTALLRNLSETVKPQGLVIVSVPALPDLFSDYDRVQGHRRRYLPERLRSAFIGTGLEPVHVFWWGAWMVPLLRRRRQNSKTAADASPLGVYRRQLWLPPLAPMLMQIAFRMEETKAIAGRTREGTSLVAVARRA